VWVWVISTRVGDAGKECVCERCSNVNLQARYSSHRPVVRLISSTSSSSFTLSYQNKTIFTCQTGELCKQLCKTNSRQNVSEHNIVQRNLLSLQWQLCFETPTTKPEIQVFLSWKVDVRPWAHPLKRHFTYEI